MSSSSPERYTSFDRLVPGNIFCWAMDVKTDHGYVDGPVSVGNQYRINKKGEGFRPHVYFVVSSHMARQNGSASKQNPTRSYRDMWEIYAWSFRTHEFRFMKHEITPRHVYSDVLVLT